MISDMDKRPPPLPRLENEPILDARIRLRLGRQLQALYSPVLDEGLDSRLAALVQQLEQDGSAPENA